MSGWKPPPKLTLSQWAEQHAYLSPESAAEPGKWHSVPYQVGIMDALTDPSVETVVVRKSARVGYTKILNHLIGYSIHQDPAPILVVQPTLDDAEGYSKDELEPMLRDTPVLKGVVSEKKSRDSANTILRKKYRGGTITLVGANAARGFRRITVKRVIFDEVDGYPPTAGAEGDQIKLGIRRSDTYHDRKIVLGSTPTFKGGRIDTYYENSDKRQYFVPCPHCGEFQTLKWSGIVWAKIGRAPEDAGYLCEHCGTVIEQTEKRRMVAAGEWRPTSDFRGIAGFHIWAAYSFSPATDWGKLAREFVDCGKDPEKLKTFVNTVLGEPWEDDGERFDDADVRRRGEHWSGVPDGVLVRTAGIDVQTDRVEVEHVGWGVGDESWSLDYRVIHGDPSGPALWADVDRHLAEIKPHAVCIDSGGANTQAVYAYCKGKLKRRIYAIKGAAGNRLVWPQRSNKVSKYRVNLFIVGVDAAKEAIYNRLKITEPGPGYCHFPEGRGDWYFDGLTAETKKTKYSNGFASTVWTLPSGKRNEPLDCRVYAYAALCSFSVNWAQLSANAAKKQPKVEVVEQKTAEPMKVSEVQKANQWARPVPKSWATNW